MYRHSQVTFCCFKSHQIQLMYAKIPYICLSWMLQMDSVAIPGKYPSIRCPSVFHQYIQRNWQGCTKALLVSWISCSDTPIKVHTHQECCPSMLLEGVQGKKINLTYFSVQQSSAMAAKCSWWEMFSQNHWNWQSFPIISLFLQAIREKGYSKQFTAVQITRASLILPSSV